MKRTLFAFLMVVLVAMLSACGGGDTIGEVETPVDIVLEVDDLPEVDGGDIEEETFGEPNELLLNRAILENVGRLFREILRDEPNLEPQDFGVIDAAAMCFTDSSKPYSYILFVTQYLPYDEYAEEAIEQKDIRCAGIYTTVGEMFPDFVQGEDPEAFFERAGIEVEALYTSEIWDRGFAYFAYFRYEQMWFQIWGGEASSPAMMSAGDFVTAEISTENENLINEYYNDKLYPDGIGCVAAIDCARAYRISLGGSDCSFSIGRDAVIDAWDSMNLPDEKVYIVSPDLDWETDREENSPVYYVGYTSGEVYEMHLRSS